MDSGSGSNPSESLEAWIADVRSLVEKHVGGALAYYEARTQRPWLLFRICGTLLIVLSISLPVLSSLKPDVLPSKDLVVSCVALAVAVLSALSTFFHWHETWRENTRAKLELQDLLAVWNLKLLAARQSQDAASRVGKVIEATEVLFAEARKVATTNTEGYFKNVRLPEVRK